MIYIRLCWFGLVVGLFLGLLAGCGKSDPQSPASDGAAPSSIRHPQSSAVSAPALKLHWLGKKRLATESNTTNFMAIWNLPESARLEVQTLDKLSTAPWRLLKAATPLSNAPIALLRPLLDDLVQEESYLEVATTNQPAELVFAIRLPSDRAGLWRTNLAAILESLFGLPPTLTSQGWLFTKHDFPDLIEFTQSGDWILVGAATKTNAFLSDLRSKLDRNLLPFHIVNTNGWLSLDLAADQLNRLYSFGWSLPVNFPSLHLATTGDSQNVRISGELNFPLPVLSPLEPWQIPTNLISDPLIAFSSFRGISPWIDWLQSQMPIAFLKSPDQMFTWAGAGYPLQTYLAVPQPGATNAIGLISRWLTQKVSTGGYSNFPGRFTTATNLTSVTLDGIPFMSARLEAIQDSTGEFLFGSLVPMMRTNHPMPVELLAQVLAKPSLVYYDWEITGPRIEAWIYIGQTLRLVFSRAQLPPASTGFKWLKALLPLIGNSATAVTASAPTQLSFTRTSTLGLTGLELHLLIDWLESPDFPQGLHTAQAQPMRGLMPLPAPKKSN